MTIDINNNEAFDYGTEISRGDELNIALENLWNLKIFSDLQMFLINLIRSSASKIVKFELSPAAAACFLKSFAQIEWKVPNQESPVASDLRILLTLYCISLAALFVKVTDKIWLGNAFFFLIICAILAVNTFVFPDPAPATIKIGPLVLITASFCAELRFFKYSKFIIYK